MAKRRFFEIRIVETENGLKFEYNSKPSAEKIEKAKEMPECVAFGLQAANLIEKYYNVVRTRQETQSPAS